MRRIHPETLAFTLLLGALGALPPLSIDMALPALGHIAASLHRSIGDVTLTLSLFMAGFSSAQLLFGPLSDRYGRRPVLLAGCGLFALASLACAVAPSLESLLAARFAEGCGAGAGMVMVFAMVRDLFDGHRARTKLSYVNLVLGVAPMIAPTLGAWILALLPWPAIYTTLAAGGLALTLAVWLGLAESLPTPDPGALDLGRVAANYRRVLGHRLAFGYILINGLAFGCMFAYVSGSSFLMIQLLGLSAGRYALTFACTALGIMAGAFLSGQLSHRHVSATVPLGLGLGGAALGSGLLAVLTLTGAPSVALFLPLLVLTTLCYGLIAPNAAHGALHPLPEIAGVAGASLGFTQMAGGALASALVAELNDGRTILSMTATMTLFAVAALLVYALMVMPAERRHEEAAEPEEREMALAGLEES